MPERARPGAVAVAFAGGTGTRALEPAVGALRARLPHARLLLLWPHDAASPRRVAALCDARLDYCVPACDAVAGHRPDPQAAVDALAAAAPAAAIVFSEPGCSPELPACLCGLAGIARRAGFAAEFSGAVLSEPVNPDGAPASAAERHLYLLDRVLR